MKVLFCATVDYHFKAFHIPYLKWFKEKGWEVHVAARGNLGLPYVDQKWDLSIQRSPFHVQNIKAYQELKTLIDQHQYNIIHCHTPMGGMLARLAARSSRKAGTKVIYTAHGFHFCKGAPWLNWLIYYPLEKMMAHLTDCLITINQEDYQLARSKFKAGEIVHVNGVGVDTELYKPVNGQKKAELRKSFGYRPDDFLLFYAAEFNKNKNQQYLIQSLARLMNEIPNAKLLLAGEGPLLQKCRDLAKDLGIAHMVDFLGFRKDLHELVPMCDVAVASSLREGLPVNIMEAMACALPIVATDNRGHRELIRHHKNGWLVGRNESAEFSDRIKILAKNKSLGERLGQNGRNIVTGNYSIDHVLREKTRVYQTVMLETEGAMWAIH